MVMYPYTAAGVPLRQSAMVLAQRLREKKIKLHRLNQEKNAESFNSESKNQTLS